jgi:hypothetical protein
VLEDRGVVTQEVMMAALTGDLEVINGYDLGTTLNDFFAIPGMSPA